MRRIAVVIALIGLVAASGCSYGPGIGFRRFHPFAPCVGCDSAESGPQRLLATTPGERLSYGSTVIGSSLGTIVGQPCDSCTTGPLLGARPGVGSILPTACGGACGGTCGQAGCGTIDACGCGQGCVGGCLGGGLVRGALSVPYNLISRLFTRQVYTGESCGGTYWGDWYSYPPACQDPCDNGSCGGCSDCGGGTTVPMGMSYEGASTQTYAPLGGLTSGRGANFLNGGSIVSPGVFSGLSPRVARSSLGSSCSSCQSDSSSPMLGTPLRPTAASPIASPMASDLTPASY
jgi:hypothetical protein